MTNELKEFQDMINDITDPALLEVAEELLREMVQVATMREKIEVIESGLSKGKKAIFWLFVMSLNNDQIDWAANTVIGRKSFLEQKERKKKITEEALKEEESKPLDDKIACLVCDSKECLCELK